MYMHGTQITEIVQHNLFTYDISQRAIKYILKKLKIIFIRVQVAYDEQRT